MTPPEITQLELEAAIAEEKASAARSRAKLAQLEHQRRLAGSPFGAGASRGVPWLLLSAVMAFVVWAVITEPDEANTASSSSALLEH